MKIIAKTRTGSEYLYDPRTAHAVSNRSAEFIKSVVNTVEYKLKENEIWHVYDIDKYDAAFDYAQYQRFSVYRGIVKEIWS